MISCFLCSLTALFVKSVVRQTNLDSRRRMCQEDIYGRQVRELQNEQKKAP